MENTLPNSFKGRLKGLHSLHIYYEDTDFSGFVYHANYLKFFERAREHLIGIDFLQELYEHGIHFVVHKANLEYKSPARHGVLLQIDTNVDFSRSPVLQCQQEAFIETKQGRQTVCKGSIDLATLNHENRPIRLPDIIIDRFMEQASLL